MECYYCVEDVVIVYREKLGKMGGSAGDNSRGRRGSHNSQLLRVGRKGGAPRGKFGKGKSCEYWAMENWGE